MIEAAGGFTLSPRFRAIMSIAAVCAGAIVEADKLRRARELGVVVEPTDPLGAVMAQSGLHIPTLKDMLAQFLGSTPEAKETASLIVDNPDPIRLLQTLSQRFGPQAAGGQASATTGSTSAAPTPPPASAGDTPTASAGPASPSAANAAPTTPPSPEESYPPPPKIRPEFGPRQATAAPSQPAAGPVEPAPTAPPRENASPRFAAVVERRMAAILERAKQRHVELMIHISECKAELAQLRRRRTVEPAMVIADATPIEPTSPPATEVEQLVADLVADAAERTEPSAQVPVDVCDEAEIPAAEAVPAAGGPEAEPVTPSSDDSEAIDPEAIDVAVEPLPTASAEEAIAALEIVEMYERQIDKIHEASRLAVAEFRDDLRQYKADAEAAEAKPDSADVDADAVEADADLTETDDDITEADAAA